MEKDESKTILEKTENILKDIGERFSEVGRMLKNDAAYGTKAGLLKLEQLTLENEKNKLLTELGEKCYALIRQKKISDESLDDLFKELQDLDNRIRGKKIAMTANKKKRAAEK